VQILEGVRRSGYDSAMPTPEEERIARVYSGMSDEELRRLRRGGDELSLKLPRTR